MKSMCKSNDFETIFDEEFKKLYVVDIHTDKIVSMLNLDCEMPSIDLSEDRERHIRDFVDGSIPSRLFGWNMYVGRDTARKIIEIT